MDRRRFLGAAAGTVGAAMAGCVGNGNDGDGAAPGGAYSVSMVPVGEVTFEGVPETWAANNGSWADMGIALGLEPPEALYLPGRYHTQYYEDIPEVSVDGSSIEKLWGSGGLGKEQFHAIDADVHVMDPNFLKNRASWTDSDVEDVAEIAPFFGNSIFSRSYGWHGDYRYYSLYEAFEKLAKVFQRTDRYEAFEEIHADFQANLAPTVPARSERPSVAVVWAAGNPPEKFYPYVLDEGTSFKHLRALKVEDALAQSDVKNFHTSRGAIDYETLVHVDPEVLLVRGHEDKSESEFQDAIVSPMQSHDVASEMTAVQNGDVYRGGGLYHGPITYQVVTERLAGKLYGLEEELFDRDRVADVVAGDV